MGKWLKYYKQPLGKDIENSLDRNSDPDYDLNKNPDTCNLDKKINLRSNKNLQNSNENSNENSDNNFKNQVPKMHSNKTTLILNMLSNNFIKFIKAFQIHPSEETM